MSNTSNSSTKSIKTNFIFNVLNTVLGLLFPLISFPYASRILLAEGIGQVNYYTSIIGYIVLLTGLGIPIYGIREVARVRDDRSQLTKTTIEILGLNLSLNILGYVAVAIMCITIEQISSNIPLFLVLSLSIVLTSLGCNWFYNGIEDFKGIAIRSLIVRTFSLFILFGLVHSKSDLLYYAIFYIVASVGSNIINFTLLRKYIDFHSIRIRQLDLLKHVRPALAVFAFSVVSSIYLNLDKVMLAAIQDTTAVGYYTAASQLSHILLTVVVSLGTVLLPRSSNLIKNNQMDDFYKLSEKSYRFIIMMATPIAMGCIVMSPLLINLFCGPSYTLSIQTLRIIAPIILVIGISQAIGMQLLYPLGKIEIVTYCTCVGALINLLLNLLLIPKYSQDGAAVSTVVAECSVTFTLFLLAKKYIPFKLFTPFVFKYFTASLTMMAVCFILMNSFEANDIIKIVIVPVAGALVYLFPLLLTKDSLLLEAVSLAKRSFIKIKRR